MMKQTTLGLLTLVAMLWSTASLAELKHVDHRAATITRARCDTANGSEQSPHVREAHHGRVWRGDEAIVHQVSPVAAPELDTTFATSALALLAGFLAIVRERRQTQKVTCQ
jgi:hypothetical protein